MYALVAFNRDDGRSSEAAMKYFVLGAVASGLLLYGISILYGLSGKLELTEVLAYVSAQNVLENIPLLFALVFIVAGISFKFGAVPFHMWVSRCADCRDDVFGQCAESCRLSHVVACTRRIHGHSTSGLGTVAVGIRVIIRVSR
jgi:hypothetical protein